MQTSQTKYGLTFLPLMAFLTSATINTLPNNVNEDLQQLTNGPFPNVRDQMGNPNLIGLKEQTTRTTKPWPPSNLDQL